MKIFFTIFIAGIAVTTLSEVLFFFEYWGLAFILNPFTLLQGIHHRDDWFAIDLVAWMYFYNMIPYTVVGCMHALGEKKPRLKSIAKILIATYVAIVIALSFYLWLVT